MLDLSAIYSEAKVDPEWEREPEILDDSASVLTFDHLVGIAAEELPAQGSLEYRFDPRSRWPGRHREMLIRVCVKIPGAQGDSSCSWPVVLRAG